MDDRELDMRLSVIENQLVGVLESMQLLLSAKVEGIKKNRKHSIKKKDDSEV